MQIYVDAAAFRDGNGSKERPFRHISDAARIARAGDEVLGCSGRVPGICGSVERRNGGKQNYLPQRGTAGGGDHRRGRGEELGAV